MHACSYDIKKGFPRSVKFEICLDTCFKMSVVRGLWTCVGWFQSWKLQVSLCMRYYDTGEVKSPSTDNLRLLFLLQDMSCCSCVCSSRSCISTCGKHFEQTNSVTANQPANKLRVYLVYIPLTKFRKSCALTSYSMKIRSMQPSWYTYVDKCTDMTKLIGTFCGYPNAPKKPRRHFLLPKNF